MQLSDATTDPLLGRIAIAKEGVKGAALHQQDEIKGAAMQLHFRTLFTFVFLSRVHGRVECSVALTVRERARVVGTRRACMA